MTNLCKYPIQNRASALGTTGSLNFRTTKNRKKDRKDDNRRPEILSQVTGTKNSGTLRFFVFVCVETKINELD